MASLASIVKIYRDFNCPAIENGKFSGKNDFSCSVVESLNDLRNHHSGLIKELSIDKREILESETLPETGDEVELVFQLPTNSSKRFYSSVSDLLSAPAVSRGEIPCEYYLISDNYFSGDSSSQPKQVDVLEKVCTLIRCLSSLAHYHDDKVKNNHFKLVFVPPDKVEKSKPTIIETKIDEKMLHVECLDISLVEALCKVSAKSESHYAEKVAVLWNTLSEFIQNRGQDCSPFSYLVMNWAGFVSSFQKNLATYISGFAFHKAKKEVAEAELAMTEKFADIFSSITGKLFSIPLSFATLVIVGKSGSPFESLIIILGLLLAAFVVVGAVGNQQQQFLRVRHAKCVMFDSFDGKIGCFPQELQEIIKTMKEGLNSNEHKLNILLWSFRVIGWIPVLIGLGIYIYLYA